MIEIEQLKQEIAVARPSLAPWRVRHRRGGLRRPRPGGGASRLVGVDLGHLFLPGSCAAVVVRNSFCAVVACADQFLQPRAAFLNASEGEGESDLRKIVRVRATRRLAAVVFVRSLNRMFLSA